MSYEKKLVTMSLFLFIAACATWVPAIGMSYEDSREHWSYSDNMDSTSLVSDDGTISVYEKIDTAIILVLITSEHIYAK